MLTQALASSTVTASPLEAALWSATDQARRPSVQRAASRRRVSLSKITISSISGFPTKRIRGDLYCISVRDSVPFAGWRGAAGQASVRKRPPAFAPDEAMFLEAWVTFATQHLTLPARTPWAVSVATTQLLSSPRG
jgi:hypothetical protein